VAVIIVTGSVRARPETADEVAAACVAHSARSRAEPGCLLHTVHRDVEDPLRFVFLEHWADRAALAAHFEVPASLGFVSAVGDLAADRPTLEIYEAEPVRGPLSS
jgi:quinol monooxygenase YgiN